MQDSWIIFKDAIAIEVFDLWREDENGDETNGYEELTE